MKKTSLILATLALATGLLAQPNAEPATPAAAPVDPAKLALAHEVIAAMHADRMFDSVGAQMKQMASRMAARSIPGQATPEQRQKLEELQSKSMDLAMAAAKGLVPQMDQVYATVYSEAELKAMKAFFLSPEGQSMLAKQPEIMRHLMPLIQQMQRDLMPKIEKLVEEAKAAPAEPSAAPAEPTSEN